MYKIKKHVLQEIILNGSILKLLFLLKPILEEKGEKYNILLQLMLRDVRFMDYINYFFQPKYNRL